MKHILAATAVSICFASPAFADVTIKSVMDGKVLGFGGKTSGTAYIKGNKMRSDTDLGKSLQSTIFDLDAQKMYFFDSRKNEVEVWDMAAFAAELNTTVDTAGMKTSFAPNGQTKPIGGQNAEGHNVEMSVPYAMGGAGGQAMTLAMTGAAWVVKGAPGTADYAQFYKAAAEKGWIFSHPSAAKAQPGQARAMAEMYREIAALGGIPYEMNVDMQIRMGDVAVNPVALLSGLLGRRGGSTMTTIVESIETGALSDDLFTPPAGIQLVPKN
jgi:opacity protein-like surface antigen